MDAVSGEAGTERAVWLVGAAWGGNNDQLPRFLRDGIWESGHHEKGRELVLAMKPGDRVVVKSTYTRSHGLPFDNRGITVATMAIKAVGTITANSGNGQRVTVDWTPIVPLREWYFSIYMTTVQRLRPGTWITDGLIAFALDGSPQDVAGFLSRSPWRTRYGPQPTRPFAWTDFYETIANALRPFRHDRAQLLVRLYRALETAGGLTYSMTDRYPDGGSGPLRDICPYTVIGMFNRAVGDAMRTRIAEALAREFGVEKPLPTVFVGVPTMNNQNSWLFGFEKYRGVGDIDALWDLFEASLDLADGRNEETRDDSVEGGESGGSETLASPEETFAAAFDAAMDVKWAKWNLTMGLYWTRPFEFAPLDGNSRDYIESRLSLPIRKAGPKGVISGAEYLELVGELETRFGEETCPVHSFPELSRAAWEAGSNTGGEPDTKTEKPTRASPEQPESPLTPTYAVADLIAEGCFLEAARVEKILMRLRQKKNLVLQGPPGTGKTWLARRLAYALIGERRVEGVTAIQFHPNLSYEDFVRGWRPYGDGGLRLVDGPLLEAAARAAADPNREHVVVIEEINRGNPAQIFGEALTLLEADKRHANEALALSYRRTEDERVHLPPNLFVIGTMNVADRSLALVDLALRRRFAFVDLAPELGAAWRAWLTGTFGIPVATVDRIQVRMEALNAAIRDDPSLGLQFGVGHSYVTPPQGAVLEDSAAWYRGVVETEIAPLLREYWFDDPERARSETAKLLT